MHGKEKGSIFAKNDLKPFGKMIFAIILLLFSLLIGEWGMAVVVLFIIIASKISNVSDEEADRHREMFGYRPLNKKKRK